MGGVVTNKKLAHLRKLILVLLHLDGPNLTKPLAWRVCKCGVQCSTGQMPLTGKVRHGPHPPACTATTAPRHLSTSQKPALELQEHRSFGREFTEQL